MDISLYFQATTIELRPLTVLCDRLIVSFLQRFGICIIKRLASIFR